MIKTIAPLAVSCSIPVCASEGNSAHELMIISKMAGVCGVMEQMEAFQSSTQLLGGDEFVERFWRAEFSKLGKNQQSFVQDCEQVNASYKLYWQISEEVSANL